MPIPKIDGIRRVIPPYLYNPRTRDATKQSPYACDMLEVATALGFTPERKQILRGLLIMRSYMLESGFVGFQWLAGSFVEDVEYTRRRAPSDIDVVSFLNTHKSYDDAVSIIKNRPDVFVSLPAKEKYLVDHQVILHSKQWQDIADQAAFWYSLLSHTKQDDTWKGILLVSLNGSARDADASKLLGVSS